MSLSENIYQQNYEEIQRRRDIHEQGFVDTQTFTKVSSSVTFDYNMPDQKYIVFSLSHQRIPPCTIDHSKPALNVFAGFPNKDDAKVFAARVQKSHPDISIFVNELHNWLVAPKNYELFSNQAYIGGHAKIMMENYHNVRQANLEEFQENVDKKQMGKIKTSEVDVIDHLNKDTSDDIKPLSHRICNSLTVRGQNFAVVSFIKDIASVPEFMFIVYGFFETENDAETYVKNTCGDKVTDFDLDVIQTNLWCFPQQMTFKTANKEVFRSNELNEIMQTHKAQCKKSYSDDEVRKMVKPK